MANKLAKCNKRARGYCIVIYILMAAYVNCDASAVVYS